MAGIYFDLDQFKIQPDIHKILEREFRNMILVKKKYFGTQKEIDTLPENISLPKETFVYERKADEENKNDFKIMAEVVKDLANPKMNWFIIATRDTDYIAHAEEIHKAGKNFGILVIENKEKSKIEPISPKLIEVCDITMTIRCGNITRKYKKGIPKGLLRSVSEKAVQTESEPNHRYTWLEAPNTNIIVGWVNYNCKGYKKIALELDDLIEEAKTKSTFPFINYLPIQRDGYNFMLSPTKFSCDCKEGILANPFARGPEACPIFHLYSEGRIQKEVIGANLHELRKAIRLVYKILV
jgi:hypothetical protein